MKYSIHRCLGELKLLDKKISKDISLIKGTCVGSKKLSLEIVSGTDLSIEQFQKLAKSKLQSIKDLIKRRNLIKENIINSNANTFIEIGGKKYTVAAAIERKNSIRYEENLLEMLEEEYMHVINKVSKNNEKVEEGLDKQISTLLGNESTKTDINLVNNLSETYRKQNQWEIVDPLDLKSVIKEMENEISTFLSEIDYKISTSNSITEVDIEY